MYNYMKDKKLKILCILSAIWVVVFGLTLWLKNPRIEQLDIGILFVCLAWFAYWTISGIVGVMRNNNKSDNKQ